MREIQTIDNETLDQVVYRALGGVTVDADYLKALYAANPNIADYGPVLPGRITIHIPDPPPVTETKLRLWD